MKYNSFVYRSEEELFLFLQPKFDMDYLLPRTFVATLSLERLERILKIPENNLPPEVSIAAIYKKTKSSKPEEMKHTVRVQQLQFL